MNQIGTCELKICPLIIAGSFYYSIDRDGTTRLPDSILVPFEAQAVSIVITFHCFWIDSVSPAIFDLDTTLPYPQANIDTHQFLSDDHRWVDRFNMVLRKKGTALIEERKAGDTGYRTLGKIRQNKALDSFL